MRKGIPEVTAAFCVALVVSNILANKIVTVWGLALTGGTALFPLTYLLDDCLTEVWGYATARRAIWTGFALQLVVVGFIAYARALPSAIPPQGREFNDALALSGWIVAGSLVAYWAGSFLNAYVLARMKVLTRARWLASRTIGSTVIGQALDSVLFIGIAFGVGGHMTGHPFSTAVLWRLTWNAYTFKCGVEIVLTPLTYGVVALLKRATAGPEHFDRGVSFSPFAVEASA